MGSRRQKIHRYALCVFVSCLLIHDYFYFIFILNSAVNQVGLLFLHLKILNTDFDDDYQGHCHPRIIATLVEQAQKLTLTSRAFYNSVFGRFAKQITQMFKYDMVLPMNTGAEAVETAVKLSRKWAYMKKGVPEGKAIVLSVEGNFHGRTLGIIRYPFLVTPAYLLPLLIDNYL